MVAQTVTSRKWHAFECKGRASVPGDADKQKAKAQAQRLLSVGGIDCTLHVGAIAFYRNDALEFYWRDPVPASREPIKLVEPEDGWGAYYAPFVDTFRLYDVPTAGTGDIQASVPIDELDLRIGIHPAISTFLFEAAWQRARDAAIELRDQFHSDGYRPDGLLVKTGPSWGERFEQKRVRG